RFQASACSSSSARSSMASVLIKALGPPWIVVVPRVSNRGSSRAGCVLPYLRRSWGPERGIQLRLWTMAGSPGGQLALPVQGCPNDLVDVVETGRPPQGFADPAGVRDQHGRIAAAARLFPDVERQAARFFHRPEYLTNAVAVAVAAVESDRCAAATQIVQRLDMGIGEVFDVDVVAHAGAVGSWIIGAEDGNVGTHTDRRFTGYLYQKRRLGGGLADPAFRVGARDVEVAQRYITQRGSLCQIPEHPLAHEIGRAHV